MSNDKEFGAKITCYASEAGMQVEETQRHKDGVPIAETVTIETWPVMNRSPDMKRKISIQLSQDELPIYAAVLLGYLPRCQFKRPDKGIFIERQKGKIYYKGTAGMGNLFQVPVPIGTTFNMSQLVLKQLTAGLETSSSEFVLAGIKGSSALYLQD